MNIQKKGDKLSQQEIIKLKDAFEMIEKSLRKNQ